MKIFFAALLTFGALAQGQPSSPIFAGPVIDFLPPAVNSTGRMIAFASSVTPQGEIRDSIDLYVNAVKRASNVTSTGMSSDGSLAVFTDVVNGTEAVGTIDTATGVARRFPVDTQGCVRPLAFCAGCFFACVVTPHATQDGGKLIYAVRRNQPFFTVNADGTGLAHLPVYAGALALAPQRVIGANGLVVFTSAAPFGPTLVASPTDVYVMNLDGTNIRNLTKFGNDSRIFSANATISADESTIIFETNYARNETQIWAVQSDGSGLRQLTFGPGAATGPSISADGRHGVFLQAGALNLLLLYLDPQPQGMRFPIAVFRYSVPSAPVITDDGMRVLFLLGPPNAPAAAVYQVNSIGSGLRSLYAPRAISPGGVVSAAGLGVSPSPGSLVSVYGINFTADTLANVPSFPLPETLAGASVVINGSKSPLLSVSPWQINAQVPRETPAGRVDFRVEFIEGTMTPSQSTAVVAAAPALFVNQMNQTAAYHAGSTVIADNDHPARPGEVLEMYGTGLGDTDPPVASGQPAPANPVAKAKATPVVLIGNVNAQVLFAGLTPGLAGVYQLNVVVPSGLQPGRYAVTLKTDQPDALGSSGTIAIQ